MPAIGERCLDERAKRDVKSLAIEPEGMIATILCRNGACWQLLKGSDRLPHSANALFVKKEAGRRVPVGSS